MIGILEDDVDHPGNGIRAITGRGSVTQHFDVIDSGQRNGVQVRRRRASPHRATQIDEGRCVTTLAVDQYQYLIRRKTAQLGRPGQLGTVHQTGPWKIDRRNQACQHRA